MTWSNCGPCSSQILMHCIQTVVVAFQALQYRSLQFGTFSISTLQYDFLDSFGLIMNGALVPVIVCQNPRLIRWSASNTESVTVVSIFLILGHLSYYHHCPCCLQQVAHGERNLTAPRIYAHSPSCYLGEHNHYEPSREPYQWDIWSISHRRRRIGE